MEAACKDCSRQGQVARIRAERLLHAFHAPDPSDTDLQEDGQPPVGPKLPFGTQLIKGSVVIFFWGAWYRRRQSVEGMGVSSNRCHHNRTGPETDLDLALVP